MHYGYGYFEEEHLGQIHDARLWRRVLVYITPHWKEVAGAIILSFFVSGSGLILPYLIREGIDRFITVQHMATSQRLAGLTRLCLIFVITVGVGFAANFLQVIVLERTGQKIMHRMRQDLFSHLLGLDLAFFNRNPVGKLVTRLTNDIQNMHEMFTSVIVTLFNDFIRIIGIMIVLFLMNRRLTLILFLLLPLMIFGTVLFSRLAREAYRGIRTHLARINSFLQEVLSSLDIIQLYLQEKDTHKKFAGLNQEYFQKTIYQIKIFGVYIPLIELFSALSLAIIIWFGGREIIHKTMTIGVLVAFMSYMRLFFQPLRELSRKYSIIQSAMASAERIFQLLDTSNVLPISKTPFRLPRIEGRIDFENMTFSYEPNHPVVRNLTLRINPRETIAIVGATGSGKTTLINLLERFYDAEEGTIYIDGHDLRKLDPRELRRQIGLVMQDIFIVSGTVRENILLDQHLDDSRLDQVVNMAQLSALIQQLPDGLDTRIGEGGQDLSAGQKQLLSFARVLARNPRILILDEATSNIDSETEIYIERAIETALSQRTSIVIAHRLSTIRRADRIVVMDQGRIAEEGTHEELLSRHGLYYELHRLQYVASHQTDGDVVV